MSEALIEEFSWDAHIEHSADLLAAVGDQHRSTPDTKLAVSTGWSGPKTLFDDARTHALVRYLVLLLPKYTAFVISGWGNIMRQGDTVARHDHARSHLGGDNILAGCYYLAACKGAARLTAHSLPEHVVIPEHGKLLLFDAALEHSVERHDVATARISIAFNVKKAP